MASRKPAARSPADWQGVVADLRLRLADASDQIDALEAEATALSLPAATGDAAAAARLDTLREQIAGHRRDLLTLDTAAAQAQAALDAAETAAGRAAELARARALRAAADERAAFLAEAFAPALESFAAALAADLEQRTRLYRATGVAFKTRLNDSLNPTWRALAAALIARGVAPAEIWDSGQAASRAQPITESVNGRGWCDTVNALADQMEAAV